MEELLSSSRIFSGRVISLDLDRVRLPSGKIAEKEVVVHRGAVAVVAIDGDSLLMERQYRHAAKRVLLEIPAGTIEEGEDPAECARRELAEETGYEAESMDPLLRFFVAPGYSTEVIHLYLARGLRRASARLEEDEDISAMFVPLSDAVEMVRKNEVEDAKTVIGILFADAFIKGEEAKAFGARRG